MSINTAASMKITNSSILLLIILLSGKICAQQTDQFHPDFKNPEEIAGMTLVWHDEFNSQGKPDSAA